MLIEFRVGNFRSFREEQVFSLVASNYVKDLPHCVIEPKLPGISKVKVLKGAAIYGANASGKSNLLQAIGFLRRLVVGSATDLKPGDPTGTQPFLLDECSAARPSKFEITFVAQGTRYVFGVSATRERIVEEYLTAYPKGLPQRRYHRRYDENSGGYLWEDGKGTARSQAGLRERTRANALYISVAAQFAEPAVMGAYTWFRQRLELLDPYEGTGDGTLQTAAALTVEGLAGRVTSLLRAADLSVARADITKEPTDPVEARARHPWLRPDSGVFDQLNELRVSLAHRVAGAEPIALPFEDESAGTQRYFALLGPWLSALMGGHTLLVDEMDTSLHPALVRELLKMAYSDAHNWRAAQVILTTHNPILLDQTLLRRDQVWFTEKNEAGATRLYPLTDFQPRKDEALAKGYLAGRYGAIPYIPDGLRL